MQGNYHAGKYAVRVESQGFGESKQKGTPYFFLNFVPVAFIDGDGERTEDIPQSRRSLDMYLTDNTAEYRIADLRRLGWQGKSFTNLDPAVAGHFSFAGQEIFLECKHEEYDGKPQERWGLPAPPRHAELGSDARGSLDRMFGKFLKA